MRSGGTRIIEAVYCLEGGATLEDLTTGTLYEVKPGTLYALDNTGAAPLEGDPTDARDLRVRSTSYRRRDTRCRRLV